MESELESSRGPGTAANPESCAGMFGKRRPFSAGADCSHVASPRGGGLPKRRATPSRAGWGGCRGPDSDHHVDTRP